MAIDMLDADSDTEKIVLISKPPGPRVAALVIDRVARSRKPFTVCFLGLENMDLPGNAALTPTLRSAAEHALGHITVGESFKVEDVADTITTEGQWIHGLYTGGTLCAEAQTILIKGGLAVASNVPVPGAEPIENTQSARGPTNILLDLGADDYTVGRPHPMIDPEVRTELLRDVLKDDQVAVVLLDVVIGFGAHHDPASQVKAVLDNVKRQRPAIIASVSGTEGDPQIRSAQVRTLEDANVVVTPSNVQSAELALQIVKRNGK